MSSNWTYSSKLCFLKKLPQYFPCGNSVRTMGFRTTGSAVKNHISSEMAKELIAIYRTMYDLWVLGLSTSSSSTTPSPTSPSSSSQDSVFDVSRYAKNPEPERSGSTSGELQKPKRKRKKGNQKKYKEIYRMNCLIGCRNSGRGGFGWWKYLNRSMGKPKARKSSLNYPWSREQKWNGVRVSTVYIRTSGRTQIVISAWRRKITRASCRRRAGTIVPRAEHFGDLITADHKILREESESRNNHRCTVVVQVLATQWIKSYPCKSKSSQEIQKNLLKYLESFTTDNSLEFGKSCEDVSWNHCTSTPHRSETHGIAERAVRRVKEGTSAVLLQSGLVNEWWRDSMECYCYLRNIQDLLSDGKTPYGRRFGIPF